jgi:streptogramin lyase
MAHLYPPRASRIWGTSHHLEAGRVSNGQMRRKVRGDLALRRLLPLALLLFVFLVAPAAAKAPQTVSGVPGGVRAMVMGPDGTLWFSGGGLLGWIEPDGRFKPVGQGLENYGSDLTIDAEGNLWGAGREGIARMTPSGTVTQFPLSKELGEPSAITAAPGGGVWFASWRGEVVPGRPESTGPAYVGRVTADGQVVSFPLPGEAGTRSAAPPEIALARDGNLWVADQALAKIDRVSPDGQITSLVLPSAPSSLTAGPEGAMWYTGGRQIGRVSLDGNVTEFPLPGPGGSSIVAGPDGNLWVGGWSLRRVTPWGQVSAYPLDGTSVTALVAGGDGSIWVGTGGNPIKWVPGSILKVPTGLPGVELASTEAVVRGGRFALVLECGGSPTRGCAGEVRLGQGDKALDSYVIPPESRLRLRLRLPAAAQRQLGRQRFWRERFSVTVEGGEEATRRVVLQVPHPLRRRVPAGKVVRIPLPDDVAIGALARGRGGDLWFPDQWGNRIVRMTPEGKFRSYRLPMPERQPTAVTAGPLRSMWFLTERAKDERQYPALARLSARGEFSEVPLPGQNLVSYLLAGPDGNLWVVRSGLRDAGIERVTPQGQVTRFPARDPNSIAEGPGGVWFTASDLTIGRIALNGEMTRFRVPGRGFLRDIVAGPDGNVWFLHSARNGGPTVGRITPRGKVVEFPIHQRGHHGAMSSSIVAGPDGNLWFAEHSPPRISCVTPRGEVTHFRLPNDMDRPADLIIGPGGDLWFSQWRNNEVGIFGLPG